MTGGTASVPVLFYDPSAPRAEVERAAGWLERLASGEAEPVMFPAGWRLEWHPPACAPTQPVPVS